MNPHAQSLLPHSPDAEASVVAKVLADPGLLPELVDAGIEPRDFFLAPWRSLYAHALDAHYDDREIDPLIIAQDCSKDLTRAWKCTERQAVAKVQEIATGQGGKRPQGVAHAKLVKRHSDYRELLNLSATIRSQVDEATSAPEEIGGMAAQTAMEIATDRLLTREIYTFDQLGTRFLEKQRKLMAARQAGIELGAYFGLTFLDSYLRGLQPTELFILAGEPGSGKSACSWVAGQAFAERQMRKPADKRVGTLVLSLEMGEEPSNDRLAQINAGVDGGRIREGKTDHDDLRQIEEEWGRRKGIPLAFNFTSTLKASQLRALVVEAIRRHNIGLLIVDHMRYFDMDGRFNTQMEEEEAKARFLKENIAKDLNLAVICLAHTTKIQADDGRPRLRDLRGSYMVAAHADFVGFTYRPYEYAKPDVKAEGKVKRTDAEMIWEKNRHGLTGPVPFFFDASTMTIY